MAITYLKKSPKTSSTDDTKTREIVEDRNELADLQGKPMADKCTTTDIQDEVTKLMVLIMVIITRNLRKGNPKMVFDKKNL